ncbi:hypothetical protein DWF00_04045 [Bosea caraganae]|uniref:TIGR02301 family protein n=1 Tax=Bosea caraganae TaxID=2763117 RepID=A0A370L5M1_9HYPH|nr:hypothetical protein [Bosea caraganae]RDJ24260.1 hypothetical protein DWE98_15275 [Bosea caraganae]RDJ30302.1 hypothetical protein DWF00_04045 [Bosea caraganae]
MRLAIVIAFALASPALAQTQTQQNVMTHIARVVALSNKCAALKPNNMILGILMRQHGINLERQPYSDFVVGKGGEYAREIAPLDTAAACAMGRKLYGKAGEKVPDLLRD